MDGADRGDGYTGGVWRADEREVLVRGDPARADQRSPLPAHPISPRAFAPFGWLPVADSDPTDGAGRLEFAWADPHVNVIVHGPEEVKRARAPGDAFVCDRMFRHDSHTQALLVLDHECVLAVAPPAATLVDESEIAQISAFRLRPHDAFVLWRGTWHWGPFPVGGEPVHLYNVQGLGYEEDNRSVDLSAFAVWISP